MSDQPDNQAGGETPGGESTALSRTVTITNAAGDSLTGNVDVERGTVELVLRGNAVEGVQAQVNVRFKAEEFLDLALWVPGWMAFFLLREVAGGEYRR